MVCNAVDKVQDDRIWKALRLRLERIERMPSLNKLTKDHPIKKKVEPAPKKESHKRDVSSSDRKRTDKKVIVKVEPKNKKKTPPTIKPKPSRGSALPVAAKKQAAKSKPAAKAVQESRKKEAVDTKPSKSPVPADSAKKQAVKVQPAGKAEKHAGQKTASTVEEKTVETKPGALAFDQVSEEKAVIMVAEEIRIQSQTISPVELGKRYKCYKCGIKFYDLGKPQPLCPSCGANQLDGVIKAARKRRGKQRSAFAAKTEPINTPAAENENLHEVVDELDSEFVLDMEDIVLEEHEDA